MKIDHQDARWRRARRAVCASRAGLAEETLCSASPCSRAPAGRGWRLRLPTGRLACGRNPGLRAASLPGPRAAPSRRHRPGRGRASRPCVEAASCCGSSSERPRSRSSASGCTRVPLPPPSRLLRGRPATTEETRQDRCTRGCLGSAGTPDPLRTHLRFPPPAWPACPRQAAPRWASSPAVVGCSAQRKQPLPRSAEGTRAAAENRERLLGASGGGGGAQGQAALPSSAASPLTSHQRRSLPVTPRLSNLCPQGHLCPPGDQGEGWFLEGQGFPRRPLKPRLGLDMAA